MSALTNRFDFLKSNHETMTETSNIRRQNGKTIPFVFRRINMLFCKNTPARGSGR